MLSRQGQSGLKKMSLQSNRFAPIVLTVVLSLMIHLILAQEYDKKLAAIKIVQQKLDKFCDEGKSDLTEDELRVLWYVYHEGDSMDPKGKGRPKDMDDLRKDPGLRLVIDFAINPALNSNSPRDVGTIQENYKLFKEHYESGTPFTYDVVDRSLLEKHYPDTVKLFRKLGNIIKSLPVWTDFENARLESSEALKRMNWLAERGEVYNYLDEYKRLVTFFNYPQHKPLFLDVFPAMGEPKVSGDAEVLIFKYLMNTDKYGFLIGWTRIDVESKQPGFITSF